MSLFLLLIYIEKVYKIDIDYTSNLAQRFLLYYEVAEKAQTYTLRPQQILQTQIFEIKDEEMIGEKELKSAKGREFIRLLITE